MPALSLFCIDETVAARNDAIDRLHDATAIYTAEPVVDELLDQLDWPCGAARLVDPSCGDGMFLGRALTRALAQHTCADDSLPSIIEGWEIHPHACSQARARIEAIFIAHGRAPAAAQRLASRIVHNRDFLTEGPTTATYRVIAGNPPYLRWVGVPKILRDEYAAHVPAYAAGDMLHSFMDRCVKCLEPDGQIGLVTSDRWLTNSGTALLRETIGKRMRFQYLRRLDITTAFYRPKDKRQGKPARIHPVALVLAESREGLPVTRAPIYPGVDESRYAGLPTLADFATVRLAPWLGAKGRFFMTVEEAMQAGLPSDALVPMMDTDDIDRATFTMRQPNRVALLTRPDVLPCEAVLAHLERNPKTYPGSSRIQPWMPPESFHNLDLSVPSLFLPRIAMTPRPIPIPAKVLPMNHHFSIVPHDPSMTDAIVAAMSGKLATQWLREHGAPLEGGYFQLKAPQLRNLPIDFSEAS